MTHNKTKKVARYRGSKTHGGGAMKKRRGAGHRGGRGNAGSGKRGDAKKPSFWKNKRYYGKHGFTSVKKINFKALNIKDLNQTIEQLVKDGKATKEGQTYVVDFKKLGYNKLLGTSNTKNAYKITVEYASKKAIDKITKAGGEVIGLKPKKVRKQVKKEDKKKVEDDDDESEKADSEKKKPAEKKSEAKPKSKSQKESPKLEKTEEKNSDE